MSDRDTGDNDMTQDASIWYARVRDKECPLPADLAPLFTDSTYGNDVCPSYSTKDGHLMIWLHDKDTWEDAYGDPVGGACSVHRLETLADEMNG